MPRSEFHLKAAEEGNLVGNNSESRPQSLWWAWSPRLRNPAHGWGWRGDGGAGRCSVGLGTPVAAQGHSLQHRFVTLRWPNHLPPTSNAWSPRSTSLPRHWVPTGLLMGLVRAGTDPALGPAPPGLSIAMTSAGSGAGARPCILTSWQGCRHNPHLVKSCRQAGAFIPYAR